MTDISTILYVFFTHELNFERVNIRIIEMMKNLNNDNYIIVKGIDTNTYYDKDKKVLNINCNDKYEGLPEKVFKSFIYLINNIEFNNYNYFVKLDDDMVIKKLIYENEITDIINNNYCGNVHNTNNGDRTWHIGKCSKDSIFNTTEYTGKYVPWCLGGYGYIISRYAISLIQNNNNYKEHIYEDLYISILLNENNIKPENITITKYFLSPDHN